MIRRSFLVVAVLSAMLSWGEAAYAQGEEEYDAAIYSGLCDEIGDQVRRLDALQFEIGEWRGTEGAPSVLESETEDIDDVPAEELFDTPHVVIVAAEGEAVACGEFGGLVGVVRDQDLVFGLAPIDESGYVGMTIVDGVSREDDDDQFDVNVYVVHPETINADLD